MQSNYNTFYFKTVRRWQMLFALCAGLFIASTFVMKWIESDLVFEGKLISILGLEFFYSKDTIESIFGGITPEVRRLLGYHLYFDFIFMMGCFPGIAALCMIVFHRSGSDLWKRILMTLAVLQVIAWACDVAENIMLIRWLSETSVRHSMSLFRFLVFTKWIIAVTGFLVAIVGLMLRRKNR